MTDYDELVERCFDIRVRHVLKSTEKVIELILAEVARTLENVTPEMVEASYQCERSMFGPHARGLKHSVIFEQMLRASPLFPPRLRRRRTRRND